MGFLNSVLTSARERMGFAKQIGEEEFKAQRRAARDPVTRSGVCYVPIQGFESTRHYRDKQNLHHLGRYEWAQRVLAGRSGRGSVLDCSCGSGYGSLKLAQIFDRVDAVDQFAEAIEMGRERYDDQKINWHCVAAEKLRSVFGDASFDAVVSMQTIEFIEDDQAFLDDLFALLKPGGVLLIDTPIRKQRVENPENPHHKRYYGIDEWLEMLSSRFRISAFGQLPEADFLERCQMPSQGSIVFCEKVSADETGTQSELSGQHSA
ncbi:MAG: class I SAM-dependent methyltransferase [Myxococcota bacterium]